MISPFEDVDLITDLFMENVRVSLHSGEARCIHGAKDVTECSACRNIVAKRLKAIECTRLERARVRQLIQSGHLRSRLALTPDKESHRDIWSMAIHPCVSPSNDGSPARSECPHKNRSETEALQTATNASTHPQPNRVHQTETTSHTSLNANQHKCPCVDNSGRDLL